MERNPIIPPSFGTTLKFLVSADLGNGLHMEDVDFQCSFFRAGLLNSQLVKKEDMLKLSADEYLAVVNTRVIGTGEYYMKLTAFIPDTDVEGGLREEVITIPTGIRINN